MAIKLSVCVTSYTYNRPERLQRTLQSLAAQTRAPDEVIISDDCSPNDVTEVVNKWSPGLPNLRFNRNSTNLGMPANLNLAMNMASGDYIANFHDGDEYVPSLLEKWERALDAYPSAGFSFCGIGGWPHSTHQGNGVILHDVAPLTPGRVFFETHFLHKWASIVWGTVIARRTAYAELLPFDSEFGYISDVDMWMRMCLCWDVAYVREPLIVLDNTPTSWRVFRWDRLELARKMQLANIQRFYAAQPDRLYRELVRHEQVVRQVYMRRLLGRLWHRDWVGLREGLKLCRAFYWPLRLPGVSAGG